MNQHYLLLTPGPITTTDSVKAVMQKDWCTWDQDYNDITQSIRQRLVALASRGGDYSCVLMQGSGTAAVESVIGSALGQDDELLILANGAYGQRMAQIAQVLGIRHQLLDFGELAAIDLAVVEERLRSCPAITHVAMVHCETTTGRLNPLAELAGLIKQRRKTLIVDAMSSFGGIPLDMAELDIDFLISSANKCIEGIPGFGFVIARRAALHAIEGQARSLALDLFDQWHCMELHNGKWRFTSPTHVVRAFAQALDELAAEGGIASRHARYSENQQTLVDGMAELGFEAVLDEQQSPIITAFHYPQAPAFQFRRFYDSLKAKGFVIYPGKVSDLGCFRIGSIGNQRRADVERLLSAVQSSRYWL